MKRLLALIILVTLAPAYSQTIFMVCGDLGARRAGIDIFSGYYAAVDGNYFEYSKEDNEWNVYCKDSDTSLGKRLRMRSVCSLNREGVSKLTQTLETGDKEWTTLSYQRLDFQNLRAYYSEKKYQKCEPAVPRAWAERVEKERLAK